MPFALPWRRSTATVSINGKPVVVEWSRGAAKRLTQRAQPLVLDLELYFSCLVKKFVHFVDVAPAAVHASAVRVAPGLELSFRTVTSTPCTMELAERLGRQPEVLLDTPATRKLAPRRVWLDFVGGRWQADFWM